MEVSDSVNFSTLAVPKFCQMKRQRKKNFLSGYFWCCNKIYQAQTWVWFVFPRKFRELHEINFQNKIVYLLRASYVHVFYSLRLSKWWNIGVSQGYFVAKYKKKSMGHRRLCSRFRLLYTLMSASSLTHFWPVFPLYTPWKYQKTFGIKRKHWPWVKAFIKYFEVIKRTKMIRVIFLLSLMS